jgi:hypothetical protein
VKESIGSKDKEELTVEGEIGSYFKTYSSEASMTRDSTLCRVSKRRTGVFTGIAFDSQSWLD